MESSKPVGNAKNHIDDVVTVTLSEQVMRSNGSSLALSDTPSVVFYVWEKNPNDTTQFNRVDILVRISAFTSVSTANNAQIKQSVVSFKMSNNNDLSSKYFMNINTGTMYISDNAQPQNLPNLNNQKVRVSVIPIPIDVTSFPNPAAADASRVIPGEFYAKHDPTARNDLKSGRVGGSISTINLSMPVSGVKTRCYVKIYDAVGNLVSQAKNDNILESVPSDVVNGEKTAYDVDIYWNGFTAQKSKAAPGVYMEVIYIEYWVDAGSTQLQIADAKLQNDKVRKGKYPLVSMVGIRK